MVTIFFKQWIKNRRAFDHLLKAFLRRTRLLPADQQIKFPDLRQIHQSICQPYLADKSSDADQHHTFSAERFAHRKRRGMTLFIEVHNRADPRCWHSHGGHNRRRQRLRTAQSESVHPSRRTLLPIRPRFANPSKQPPGTYYRTQQSPRRHSIPKIEPVCNNPAHSQMPRQRPHHMLQPLTHEHHIGACGLQSLQLPHSLLLKQRLQLVFEFFFAQQIKPVTSDSAEDSVHDSSRGDPVCRIQEWTQQRHYKHEGAACGPRDKRLAVPGEKGNWTNRGQLQQAPLHPPINGR